MSARVELNAILTEKHELHPALGIFRMAFRDGSVLAFEAGQFVRVGLPGSAPASTSPQQLVLRAYSLASGVGEREMELFLRRVSTGKLSPQLFALEPGASLYVEPRAHGHFTLGEMSPGKDLVLIATGTGVAPYLSMLRTHARAPRRPWRRVAVVHGARIATDLGYAGELARLATELSELTYRPLLSREPATSEWSGLRGRVQDLLAPARWSEHVPFALDPDEVHVFLCGNPAMIAEVTELLGTRGFRRSRRDQPGTLHTERYW